MASEQRRQASAGSKAQPATRATREDPAPDTARVAERAYEIWQQSGRPNGRDQDHWFQAEREVRGRKLR